MDVARRTATWVVAGALALGLAGCSEEVPTPASADGANAPRERAPAPSPSPTPARTGYVECRVGGPTTVVLDFDPSAGGARTAEDALRGLVEHRRSQRIADSARYVRENFTDVRYRSSHGQPGAKPDPARRRSYLGSRPDGTGFARIDFERSVKSTDLASRRP